MSSSNEYNNSQESFNIEEEINELEINNENIENSESLFISTGFLLNSKSFYKENKDTIKIYGTEDYVLFIYGFIIPKIEFMNPKIVKSINSLSSKYKDIKLFICQGLIRIPVINIINYLNKYKENDKIIILTELTSRINKKEKWYEKLLDEDYKFFIEKKIKVILSINYVLLIVNKKDYIEFISE